MPIMKSNATSIESSVCSGRGKSYCLVHRRYFETSWCPDCSRSNRKLYTFFYVFYSFFNRTLKKKNTYIRAHIIHTHTHILDTWIHIWFACWSIKKQNGIFFFKKKVFTTPIYHYYATHSLVNIELFLSLNTTFKKINYVSDPLNRHLMVLITFKSSNTY